MRKREFWRALIPPFFVVRIDEQNYFQRLSFSYADVLTETVELSFKEGKKLHSVGM